MVGGNDITGFPLPAYAGTSFAGMTVSSPFPSKGKQKDKSNPAIVMAGLIKVAVPFDTFDGSTLLTTGKLRTCRTGAGG